MHTRVATLVSSSSANLASLRSLRYVWVLLAAAAWAAAPSAASAQGVTQGNLQRIGPSSLQTPTTLPSPPTSSTTPRLADREPDLIKIMRGSTHLSAPLTRLETPTALNNATVGSGGSALTFNGLDNVDSGNVNGFDVTPPDQGMCAGNGFILEQVNLASALYTQSGSLVAGPQPLSSFFITGSDFVSDPRCYFDQTSSRWFATLTDVQDFSFLGGESSVRIAVSIDANPMDGFVVFLLPTGDDGVFGTPVHPGCPCFGDQPLIGADNNGFYISTNEFSLFQPFFNGAQIYAISKVGLEIGFAPFEHLDNISVAGGMAASVQPATSPAPNVEPNNGTEFFMSSLNFIGASDNRIAVWALTNTSSLNSSPNVALQNQIVNVKVYEEPFGATQEVGPIPLGSFYGDVEETLATDDNRMQQVVFSGSYLYSALTSTIFDGKQFVNGIEWFVIKPGFTKTGQLKAQLKANDYLTVKGQNLIYPAIGISEDDQGAMVFTLSGPNFFPSAAFVKMNAQGASGPVHVVALGGAPQDDFSGYLGIPSNQQLAARWGDYSAAVADGDKNIFIATEYISGIRRDFFVNWSTSISEVRVQDTDK
jgi:hypothetical protein